MRAVPKVPEGHLRADRAILAAFFAANGARISDDQIARIIPPAAPQGRMDRSALRSIAGTKGFVLTVVKADERFLWEELGRNLPLLVLLPADVRYCPSAAAFIPVAWDQKKRIVELLDGNGEIQTIPEASFFARREEFGFLHGLRRRTMARLSARASRSILACSEFTRGEVRRHLGDHAADKTRVVRLGPDDDLPQPRGRAESRQALGLGPDTAYIITVGTVLRRRNVSALIRAIRGP